jgi:phosphoglycerol transferase MdoB-like AlkP superfamily enzyme
MRALRFGIASRLTGRGAIASKEPHSFTWTEKPDKSPHMIGTIIGLVLLVALLGVMFYCARMLLPLISPMLGVLIILLVAIATLYVIVVLLSVVGIHVPVPGFR